MPARHRQAASGQSRRALRSQSQEVADSDAENNASRQTTKKKRSRRNGVNDQDIAEGTPPSAQPDLSAVAEDLDEDVNIASHENKSAKRARKDPAQAGFEGVQEQSLLSGTTARPSGSERDLQQLSLDSTLIEPLPDLWQISGKVLDFLPAENAALLKFQDSIQDTIASQAEKRPPRDPRSVAELRSLIRNRGTLEATLRDCLSSESASLFVDTPAMFENIYGPELAAAWSDQNASPDPIFRMANLATAASNALTYPYKAAASFLEDLDTSFPGAFSTMPYDDTSPDSLDSSKVLLDLAIDVRTQCTISQLEKHVSRPNFDQDDVIREIFFEAGDDLRDWNWREFRVATGTTKVQSQISERVQEIQELVSQMSQKRKRAGALDSLKSRFPWSTFSYSLLAWFAQEALETKLEIEELGGEEILQQRLQGFLVGTDPARVGDSSHGDSGRGAPEIPHLMQSDAANSRTHPSKKYEFGGFQPTSSTSVQLTREFAKLGQTLSQTVKGRKNVSTSKLNRQAESMARGPERSDGTERATTSRGDLAGEDDWQPEPAGDDFDDGPRDLDVTSRIIAARDRDVAARQASLAANKENVRKEVSRSKRRLLDAQEGATRVPDYEEMDSNGSLTADQTRNKGRRMFTDLSRGDGEEDGEGNFPQEEGSDQDHEHPIAAVPIRKRKFTDFSREEEEEEAEEAPATSQPRSSAPNGFDQAAGTAPPSSLADVNRRRRQLAHMEFMHNRVQPEVQTRRPWSPEEENQLVALIDMNGISWSSLKAIDGNGILKHRDQVALKDKARNLKMDYLKTNGILPRNFEKVKIQQSFIDRLESMGIIYDPVTGDRADRLPPTP